MARKNEGGSLDAIELLEAQHREAERLFQQIGRGANGRDVRPALLELADILTTHASIEEKHFYPAARAQGTEELVDHSYDEHREVKALLLHLLDADPADEDFAPQLEELQGLVESHVIEEEGQLFPKVRGLLSADQLEGLAQEMTAAMVELQEEGAPHRQLAAEMEAPK